MAVLVSAMRLRALPMLAMVVWVRSVCERSRQKDMANAASALVGRIRNVLLYPHPILRLKTTAIRFEGRCIEPSAAQVAADLVATASAQDGLGLAASQECSRCKRSLFGDLF